jgi:hypothetical protein
MEHWSCSVGEAVGLSRCSDGNGCGVCGEDVGVVDLAYNPLLYEVDVLDCRDLDGLLVVVQPGVSMAAGRHCRTCIWVADRLACPVIYYLDDLNHLLQ